MDISPLCKFFFAYVHAPAPVFYLIYQETVSGQPEDYAAFGVTLFTTFRSTLGITEIGLADIESTRFSWLVAIFLVLFLVFSALLLVNFLIAMMGEEQQKNSAKSDKIWKGQVSESMYHAVIGCSS